MAKQIASIAFIYVCLCACWYILGNVVLNRSYGQHDALSASVQQLWGTPQTQSPPIFTFTDLSPTAPNGVSAAPSASNIDVAIKLEQRKKGLIWYPTYRVHFSGDYEVVNNTDHERNLRCDILLPSAQGVYDNLHLSIGKQRITEAAPKDGGIIAYVNMQPNERQLVHFEYDSQGLDQWRYGSQKLASQVRNFKLNLKTDFKQIDFPAGTRSPTTKQQTANGWDLRWKYDNTIASDAIGVSMPHLLNPGPWVSEVTFFAPVSLFFFFFVLWLITTVKAIPIHPMHYFFIGASFFSFHLLLAYSVDHMPVQLAFALASLVSIFLVLTYIRRAIPNPRLFTQIGLAQFVYLVFFSFTFFLQEFTGLIITTLSILTLFICMQYTARFDWSIGFKQNLLPADEALALIEREYGS